MGFFPYGILLARRYPIFYFYLNSMSWWMFWLLAVYLCFDRDSRVLGLIFAIGLPIAAIFVYGN